MKILDIAVKDITRSFRSYFALMFMFGVPLLMGGMFYLMFGSRGNSGGFSIPVTNVVVANLDAGGPGFEAVKQQFSSAPDAHSMGELLLSTLQNEQFADLMSVSAAESARPISRNAFPISPARRRSRCIPIPPSRSALRS
jgi:hypothetical protein